MKAILRITLLFASIAILAVSTSQAQRVIKGTVYMDGKPAAGVTVEAHKGGSMMTSFDGKYEVEADAKTKWLKFTFIDESKKLEIAGKSGNNFDFAFTGEIPSANSTEGNSSEVNLQSVDELIRAQNVEFRDQYSLYTEFFKQNDYKSAFPHWQILYSKYPKSTQNIYIQGAKMLEDKIDKASTDEEKDKILDDYMKLYDQRIKYFGQKGFLLGRKGTSWLRYKIDATRRVAPLEGDDLKKALKVGYEMLMESYKEQGLETELPITVLIMQTSRSLFKLGELPKETVVENYDKCNKVINSIIDANEDEAKVADAKEIQAYIENLFGTSGAADCEALVNIFTPQFQEKSDDIEFIKNMLRRLRKAKCDESDLVEKATIRLYELEPSAEAAFNMARGYLKENDIEKAKEYYKQAMDQETDQELLATYYYEYAFFVYAKENALSEARSYARKALALNPDYCDANMLIGDIYVAASKTFEGSTLEKAAVFWVAVDYYNKARRSEDCSIDAAQKISTFKKYFPNKEDAFMEGLQAGQSYKVEGWINETTKVRF